MKIFLLYVSYLLSPLFVADGSVIFIRPHPQRLPNHCYDSRVGALKTNQEKPLLASCMMASCMPDGFIQLQGCPVLSQIFSNCQQSAYDFSKPHPHCCPKEVLCSPPIATAAIQHRTVDVEPVKHRAFPVDSMVPTGHVYNAKYWKPTSFLR